VIWQKKLKICRLGYKKTKSLRTKKQYIVKTNYFQNPKCRWRSLQSWNYSFDPKIRNRWTFFFFQRFTKWIIFENPSPSRLL